PLVERLQNRPNGCGRAPGYRRSESTHGSIVSVTLCRNRPKQRSCAARRVSERVAPRSPNLYQVLRRFCLGAFAFLYREPHEDVPLSFAFEEHSSPGRPKLYEYRPLVRGYVEARADRLARLGDAHAAAEELEREPAAVAFVRARTGNDAGRAALFRTVLLPFL